MQDICIKGSDVKKVYEQMNFGTALCSKSQRLLIDMRVLFSTRLTLKQLCELAVIFACDDSICKKPRKSLNDELLFKQNVEEVLFACPELLTTAGGS